MYFYNLHPVVQSLIGGQLWIGLCDTGSICFTMEEYFHRSLNAKACGAFTAATCQLCIGVASCVL